MAKLMWFIMMYTVMKVNLKGKSLRKINCQPKKPVTYAAETYIQKLVLGKTNITIENVAITVV